MTGSCLHLILRQSSPPTCCGSGRLPLGALPQTWALLRCRLHCRKRPFVYAIEMCHRPEWQQFHSAIEPGSQCQLPVSMRHAPSGPARSCWLVSLHSPARLVSGHSHSCGAGRDSGLKSGELRLSSTSGSY